MYRAYQQSGMGKKLATELTEKFKKGTGRFSLSKINVRQDDFCVSCWAHEAAPQAESAMTPFELSLEKDLKIEWQRFASDGLFKWLGMTYEKGRYGR